MTIDAKLYREAREAYRQWNEAELRERLQRADTHPPDKAWWEFVDLWEFGWRLNLQPSEGQQQQKLVDLNRYYERLRRFEAWRTARGRAS